MERRAAGSHPCYTYEERGKAQRIHEYRGASYKSSPVPYRYGGEWLLVDVSQLVDDHSSCGEDPVSVEEGVQEVYGKEAQVRQTLQEALHASVSDLGDFAGVECLREANINIVFMQSGIGP